MKTIALSAFLFFAFAGTAPQNLQAQVHIIPVKPELTDSHVRSIHGDHFAFLPKGGISRGQLLLMIEGTGAAAREHMLFDTVAANLGYAVISLDYSNEVITTTCSNSNDSACFDGFREEIVFGTPVSPIVDVDSANSIYHRFYALLKYLVKTYPKQGWQDFIHGNELQWNKIIVAGHSQGAGHAAYLGKKFDVARVLVFAGPQDFLAVFHTAANWLTVPGKTETNRYFAFLHNQDPYDFRKQLYNCRRLMEMKGFDTLYVKPNAPLLTDRHILVTDIQTGNPHGSMLEPAFSKVWEYMLETDPTGRKQAAR